MGTRGLVTVQIESWENRVQEVISRSEYFQSSLCYKIITHNLPITLFFVDVCGFFDFDYLA